MPKEAPALANLRRQIRASKAEKRPPLTGDPMDTWIRRHHDRICDYLAQHLEGYEELACWEVAYTALHEFLGAVWFQPRDVDPGTDEKRIWATFEPGYFVFAHYPALRPFSFLPEDFSPRGFQSHYEGFFRFLAQRRVMSEAHAERLAVELHEALWGEAVGVA